MATEAQLRAAKTYIANADHEAAQVCAIYAKSNGDYHALTNLIWGVLSVILDDDTELEMVTSTVGKWRSAHGMSLDPDVGWWQDEINEIVTYLRIFSEAMPDVRAALVRVTSNPREYQGIPTGKIN